jgi:hypothetical protein
MATPPCVERSFVVARDENDFNADAGTARSGVADGRFRATLTPPSDGMARGGGTEDDDMAWNGWDLDHDHGPGVGAPAPVRRFRASPTLVTASSTSTSPGRKSA